MSDDLTPRSDDDGRPQGAPEGEHSVTDPTAGGRRGPAEDGTTGATRSESKTGGGFWHAIREFVIVVALALALSLAVKTWLMQAFYIPSASMEDTLVRGDRVVVSKLTPKPFSLERGDIVVFEDSGHWLQQAPATERSGLSGAVHDTLVFVGLLPTDSDNHLIKRVIGLPGDKVKCCTQDGRITVNGAAITEDYLKPGNAPSEEPFDITVPADKVWVMGDHRADSSDSRYHDPSRDGSTGAVPVSDIVGRAVAVVWPLSDIGLLHQPSSVFSSVPAPR